MHVWLDVTIPKRSTHDAGKGRLIFELFEGVVPRTYKNFCQLITGEKGDGLRTKVRPSSAWNQAKAFAAATSIKMMGLVEDRSTAATTRTRTIASNTNADVLTTLTKRPNANQSQFEILLDDPSWTGGASSSAGWSMGMRFCRSWRSWALLLES